MPLASKSDEAKGTARILYWWRPPVGPDESAEVGKGMFAIVVTWLAVLIAIAVVLGILLAVTG